MNKFNDFLKKNGIRLGIVVLIVALIYGFAASRSNGDSGMKTHNVELSGPQADLSPEGPARTQG